MTASTPPAARELFNGLIRKYEGCKLTPYRDVAGNWTIGWGIRYLSDGTPVAQWTPPISQAEADAELALRTSSVIAAVDPMLPHGTTSGQAAALYDFAFNCGVTALANSKLLELFRSGDLAGAAGEFERWIHSGGRVYADLIRRRADELALFNMDSMTVPAPADGERSDDP